MDKTDRILKSVLLRITPNERERKETSLVLEMIKKAVGDVIEPKNLSFILAGSFVRNTWMPHKKEFDIFILFPESIPREKLEKEGLEA